MKRRPFFIIVAVCIVGAIIGLLLWPSKREPEYNGVPLSAWLERNFEGGGKDGSSRDAIRHIGTNAVPFLLRWIQYDVPGWRNARIRIISKFPTAFQNTRCVQRMLVNRPFHRAEISVSAFELLGLEAKFALPELQRLANNPKAPETAARANQCLILMTQRFPDFDDVLR
jgi:hypothetical protein